MICDDVEDSKAAVPQEDTEAGLPADQTQDNRYDDDINKTITDQRGTKFFPLFFHRIKYFTFMQSYIFKFLS